MEHSNIHCTSINDFPCPKGDPNINCLWICNVCDLHLLVFSFIWVDTKFSRFYKTASKSKIWSIHKMIKSSRDELKFQIYRPHQAGSKFQSKWVLHAYGTLLQSTLRVPDNAQPNHVIPIFGEIQNFVFWGPKNPPFFLGGGRGHTFKTLGSWQ